MGNASKRPLLIENIRHRVPKSSSAPALDASSAIQSGGGGRPQSAPQMLTSSQFECDERIRIALSQRWFEESDWGKELRQMKERADNRQKLHELQYPKKGDAHQLARFRLMHSPVATLYHQRLGAKEGQTP